MFVDVTDDWFVMCNFFKFMDLNSRSMLDLFLRKKVIAT